MLRVGHLLRVSESVARESFLVRKSLLLQMLSRLRVALIWGGRSLLPLAIEAIVPRQILLPFLDLRIGVAWAIPQLLNHPSVLLDLDSVLLVVGVEHLDDRLL